MKKTFALLISLTTLGSVFAQQNNRQYPEQREDRNVTYDDRGYDQPTYGRNSNTVEYGHGQQNNRGYSDRKRRKEMDRINREYDRRIRDYRNDRSFNTYERNRRIQEAERERNGKLKSFGGGLLLGGILGVILGSQL